MKPKILLIDDEELVIKSISKILNREGYEVLVCRSGEEALVKIEDEEVRLIVCDVRMPTMSGTETIRKIREILKSKDRKPVPEILITGYAEENATREAEDLKVAEYIYKPFDLRDFLTSVKKNVEV